MATNNKNLSAYNPEEAKPMAPYNIALVVSEWNKDITQGMADAATETLLNCGILEENISTYYVPGSFELVHGCQKIVQTDIYDAVIAIGSIVRGETPHFDYVSSAVAQGISRINAEDEYPVIFCVLTDDTIEQARERSGGKHGNKGVEAAVAAIKMANFSLQVFMESEEIHAHFNEDFDYLLDEFDEDDDFDDDDLIPLFPKDN